MSRGTENLLSTNPDEGPQRRATKENQPTLGMALLPWGQMADKNFMLLANQVPQFSAAKTINNTWAPTRESAKWIIKTTAKFGLLKMKSSAAARRNASPSRPTRRRTLDGKQPKRYDLNWMLAKDVKYQPLRNRNYLVWKPADELLLLMSCQEAGCMSKKQKTPTTTTTQQRPASKISCRQMTLAVWF